MALYSSACRIPTDTSSGFATYKVIVMMKVSYDNKDDNADCSDDTGSVWWGGKFMTNFALLIFEKGISKKVCSTS